MGMSILTKSLTSFHSVVLLIKLSNPTGDAGLLLEFLHFLRPFLNWNSGGTIRNRVCSTGGGL